MNVFKRLVVVVPIILMIAIGFFLGMIAWLFIGDDIHKLTLPFEDTVGKLIDWAEKK